MSHPVITPLALYLRQAMQERHFHSERSFAAHADISPGTLSRILSGEKVDPEPLQKIADALKVPVESLYRLAGYLPPDEVQTRVLREVENLLRQLPEAEQRLILEVVRVEHKYHRQPGGRSAASTRQSTG